MKRQHFESGKEESTYTEGYEDSTADHFVPMAVIAIACAVGGCVLGMCI
jgi:hypothetical protein